MLARVAFFLIAPASALLLTKQNPPVASYPTAEAPATPEGIIFETDEVNDASKLVVCEGDKVDRPSQRIFSVMMGCNRPLSTDKEDPAALCNNFNEGGCDNELCHAFCHTMYTSNNAYQQCRCKSWAQGTKSFKDHSPGAPCPLKVQPRCYSGNLYRSECEAEHANPGVSAADFSVVAEKEWPENDTTAVKEAHPSCRI